MEPSIRIISTTTNLSRTDYGRNGNMVSDPSRGIFAIYYNPLNLPTGITMNSGARFDYLYSAAGTKLAEIIYEPNASTPTVRRDYAGIFEFENSSLTRISLASGYITPSVKLIPINSDSESPTQNVGTHPGASAPEAEDTANSTLIPNPGFPLIPTTPTLDLTATYHLYAFDHQGNVIGVYNTKTATLEQTTDYYPYGLPHATATYHSDCNRRLYSAKELTTEAGLNAYDFAARWQSPALPIFTTPDPLAEDYLPIGPHVFCGGDPINNIDPRGMDIYNIDQWGYVVSIVETDEYDEINMVDVDGNLIPEKSIRMEYGSVYYKPTASSTLEDGDIQYSVFTITDSGMVQDVFELLAGKTNVEWSAATGTNYNGEQVNIITTSHNPNFDAGITKYIQYSESTGISDMMFSSMDLHIHSHPGSIPFPSTADLAYAAYMMNRYEGLRCMVYSPVHKVYAEYDKNSFAPSQSLVPTLKVLCDILYLH